MILGARTKKVTTYGRKNTRIINVHADLSPEADWENIENVPYSTTPSKAKLARTGKVLDLGSGRPVNVGNMNGLKTGNAGYGFEDAVPTPAAKSKDKALPARRPLQSKSSYEMVPSLSNTPLCSPIIKKPRTRTAEGSKLKTSSTASTDDEPVLRKHMVSKRRVVIPRSPSASVSPGLSPRNNYYSPAARHTRGAGRQTTVPMRGSSGSASNDLAERLGRVAVRTASPEEDKKAEIEVVAPPLPSVPIADMIATVDIASDTVDPIAELLGICSYNEPVPMESIFTFPAFVACLPGILRRGSKPIVSKIGEASYSEVFSVKATPDDTEVVVKIIPLLNGSPRQSTPSDDHDDEIPQCSEIPEVVREIKLTRHMDHVPGGGFIDFLGAFVVEGAYTREMLDEWDAYEEENGSDSIRPGNFSPSQQYAFLVLSDGGDDLESYRFEHSKGWVQAAAVFWQVADALARAEKWTKFEHRDLHEGQILVTPVDTTSLSPVTNYLDPTETAVRTSIIDFGLSRLDLAEHPVAGRLPAECYEGVGPQWDVYRAMRTLVEGKSSDSDAWDGFHPRTNVLWLQYIAYRLLHATKTLRKPVAPRARRKPAKTDHVKERSDAAYAMLCLVETELAARVPGARRGKRWDFASAGDVVAWGRQKGWVL